MMYSGNNICRICGCKYYNFHPWGGDCKTASFEICDCCGVTFGYEDATKIGILGYRKEWIATGANWKNLDQKPSDWTLEGALLNIPKEYL